MAKSSRLTPVAIERTKPGAKDIWLSDDDGTRGGGRLVLRISPSGTRLFYFRYSIDGARTQIPMRPWTKEPAEGRFTLEQARAVARSYSELHRDPATRDVAAYLEQQRQAAAEAKQAEAEAKRAAAEAVQRHEKYTLLALCNWYQKHLAALGKPSAKSYKSLIACHIEPTDIAKLPANAVTPKQVAAIIRSIVEAGKGRTGGHVRSILHAAYELASKAELDGTIPAELILFAIEANPVASTASMSKYNKTRDRSLSSAELGAFWRRLRDWPDPVPLSVRALRLSLLLGGQRALQLLRVRRIEDVNLEDEIITLYDPKGRRAEARVHALPLTADAKAEVEFLIVHSETLNSPWLFASQDSKLNNGTLSKQVNVISKEFIADETCTRPFRFDDLRRTVETTMASLRISKDIRAQIQSHGISGVQARHYDRWEYMDEKRATLETWAAHLASVADNKPRASNVHQLKQA
ncbi:MAG TPA: integrase family protein [Burkholderiaceae bacterium]